MAEGSLQGRRVWVTGASLGIGRAVAVELARRGARVVISARTESKLDEVLEECGDGALIAPLDVTDREANQRVVTRIQKELGGLDIAFLNAGTCEYVDPARFDASLFERQVQVNYLALVYGIEAVLPLLRESSHPHLVGMSSTVAYGAIPRAEAYGATKAAAKYTLETLRVTLKPEGIPVSVICPGFVRTPLTAKNDFPMPFMVEVDVAARIIVDGIVRKRREIHFPRRFSWAFKLLTKLPNPLYDACMGRLVER